MSRGRTKRQPSIRNLELYHEITWLDRNQADVAEQFQISQPRVATICQQVQAWVDEIIPPNLLDQCLDALLRENPGVFSPKIDPKDLTDPGHRLHLAIADLRFRLTNAYQPFLNRFGGQQVVAGLASTVAAWNAGQDLSHVKEAADLFPLREFIESAVGMALELEQLANLAQRGPYFDYPDRFRQPDHEPNQSLTQSLKPAEV